MEEGTKLQGSLPLLPIPLFRKLYLAEHQLGHHINQLGHHNFLCISALLLINNASLTSLGLFYFPDMTAKPTAMYVKNVHTHQSGHIYKNIHKMDGISFFCITITLLLPHIFLQRCSFLLWQLSVHLTSSYIASTDTRTGRLWQVGPN